jgi:sulfur-carrier protein
MSGTAISAARTNLAVIKVTLPFHLRRLALVDGAVEVPVAGPVTVASVLDALEALHPNLTGTIRDHSTKKRRAFVRFFACQQDLSQEPPDTLLPEPVARGEQPFMVVGAIAGG